MKNVMKRRGWVYVLSHRDMPGLLKIGYTRGTVEQRVEEFEKETGTPRGFVNEYAVLVDEPEKLERALVMNG